MGTHDRSSLPGIHAGLSILYEIAQDSPYVFASPLGPFAYKGRQAHLPQLSFFGPGATDEAWRIAFLAGFDSRDSRSSRALLALLAKLSRNVELALGLNLSFFPAVDATGFLLETPPRRLKNEHWGRSAAPEISLLEVDARRRGYHGFVCVESADGLAKTIAVRVRHPLRPLLSPELNLIAAGEPDAPPIRLEIERGLNQVDEGPLSITEDLAVAPFEITVSVPSAWTEEDYQRAVVGLLERFLVRYRALQAYGQHL